MQTIQGITPTGTYAPVKVDATGGLSLGAIPAGTNNIGDVDVLTVVTGTGATNLGKAEDAVAASGDTGVAIYGVRIPTTPASPTSAAGDYGALAIDQEGKQVVSPFAGVEHHWQTNPITLTTTASTALKAAAAAGVRNYLTSLDISNTSATAVRVDILDNATVIRSYWVAGGANIAKDFATPIRGTAATAMNVQLSAAVTDVRVSANGYIGI